MLRYLFIGLLVYLLYKFIFEFLIPVARTTKDIRSKMNAFQQQANQNMNQPPRPEPETRPKGGDYIDYEEIK
jgi:hypothetical protein